MIATHVGEVGVAYVARADKKSGFLFLKNEDSGSSGVCESW